MKGSNGGLVLPGFDGQGEAEKPALRWWHVRWKRPLRVLAILFGGCLAVVVAGALVIYQLAPWLQARDLNNSEPRINQAPTLLPDSTLALLDGTRLEFQGLVFQTPWKEIFRKSEFENISSASFMNGASLMFWDHSEELGAAKWMRSDARLARALGVEAFQSNYALIAAAMNTTADQVKWWKLPSQNARARSLLFVKLSAMHDLGPVYAVNFGEMRGFQEGDPAVAPYKVDLTLFDPHDRQYEIVVSSSEGHGPVVTQAQINAMIASMRPIPPK